MNVQSFFVLLVLVFSLIGWAPCDAFITQKQTHRNAAVSHFLVLAISHFVERKKRYLMAFFPFIPFECFYFVFACLLFSDGNVPIQFYTSNRHVSCCVAVI